MSSVYGRLGTGMLLALLAASGAGAAEWIASGSGFIVNSRGDVVTNNHVVYLEKIKKFCPLISVENNGRSSVAKVIAADPFADLAVLRLVDPEQLVRGGAGRQGAPPPPPASPPPAAETSDGGWTAFTGDPVEERPRPSQTLSAPAAQRRGPSGGSYASLSKGLPVRGQRAIVVGFPLAGTLSSEHKVTDGLVASLRGENDDPRRIQISVPANPGNSGGPVFNDTGNVIGVLVSGFLQRQGANFAVSLGTLKDFLRENKVPFSEDTGGARMATEDLMAEAVNYTVFIRCGY